MKKFLLLIAIIMALLLSGCTCGDDDDDNDTGNLPSADDTGDDDTDDDDTVGDDDADDDSADDTGDDSTDDTGDDDTSATTTTTVVTTTTTTTTTFGLEIDFEDYSPGPLGAPWNISSGGASTASIITISKDGSGQELFINGGTADGDYLYATYTFGSLDFDFSISFDYWYASGASGRFDVDQSGGSIEILSSIGGGDRMYANATDCGAVSPDSWIKVTYLIDNAASTYTVLLDDAATDCNDIAFQVGGYPLAKLSCMDEFNAGRGGFIYWDNIVIAQL
jgi:hypothetical protein